MSKTYHRISFLNNPRAEKKGFTKVNPFFTKKLNLAILTLNGIRFEHAK